MSGPATENRQGSQLAFGILLAFLLHLLQIPLAGGGGLLAGLVNRDWAFPVFMSVFIIGFTQLVYLVPAILIARSKGRRALMKGLIIGGALTFMLNGLCFGLLLGGAFGRIGG